MGAHTPLTGCTQDYRNEQWPTRLHDGTPRSVATTVAPATRNCGGPPPLGLPVSTGRLSRAAALQRLPQERGGNQPALVYELFELRSCRAVQTAREIDRYRRDV